MKHPGKNEPQGVCPNQACHAYGNTIARFANDGDGLENTCAACGTDFQPPERLVAEGARQDLESAKVELTKASAALESAAISIAQAEAIMRALAGVPGNWKGGGL